MGFEWLWVGEGVDWLSISTGWGFRLAGGFDWLWVGEGFDWLSVSTGLGIMMAYARSAKGLGFRVSVEGYRGTSPIRNCPPP